MRRLLLLPALAFVGAALPVAPASDAGSPPDPPSLQRDVLYGSGGGQDLRMDIARPGGSLTQFRHPMVVFFHGGAWQKGSRAEGANLIMALASRGYIAASADYRHSPYWKFPAAVEDASCAVRFLRATAMANGGVSLWVAAWGEGEGAHLAMMLGVLGEKDGYHGTGGSPAQSRTASAVVSFYGQSDLATWVPFAGAEPFLRQAYGKGSSELLADFLGSTDRKGARFASASPLTHVSPGDAPTMSVHGENDPVVPVEQAKAYHAELKKAGVAERLEIVPGGAHGFPPADRSALDAKAIDFLDGLLTRTKPPETPFPPSPVPPAVPAPVATEGAALHTDVVYRRVSGMDLHIDVAVPTKGKPPYPCVVAFHPGPYAPAARATIRDEIFWFAANGFVAASVEYRGPVKGAYPTPVEDGRAALGYLGITHAAQYGIDPSRVAVVGRKIGGWVALHLALATPSVPAAQPKAAVVAYAPTDLADAAFDDNPHIGRLREVLTGKTKPAKDVVARASPLTHADRGDPPVLVFHNPSDLAIPFSQSERLAAALVAGRVDATLEKLTGTGHGSERGSESAADVTDAESIRTKTLAFLRRVLALPDPAPR